MHRTNQAPGVAREPWGEGGWGGVDQALRGPRNSFTGFLDNSTVGIALFDEHLRCRAINAALGRMVGVSTKKHSGRPMHQVFPAEAPQLESAFRQAWTSGDTLSNVELSAQWPGRTAEMSHWLVNFYPIKDDLGRVRLVATTFSEVTRRRRLESQLCRLNDRFRATVAGGPEVAGEELSGMSAQTLELVKRSVSLLKSSMSLRCYVSEMRLESELERLALFLTVARHRDPVEALDPPPPEPCAEPSALDGANDENDAAGLGPCCPSFRERQVLRFLADGRSNKEIGAILDISTRTVESYRARIMLKLDLHSTAALVRYAIRKKIVEA